MRTELIRKFTGEIIAKLEYQDNGDIVVRSFYGNILGNLMFDGIAVLAFHAKETFGEIPRRIIALDKGGQILPVLLGL